MSERTLRRRLGEGLAKGDLILDPERRANYSEDIAGGEAVAEEMIGPTPGTVIMRWQASSALARVSISVVISSTRPSRCRSSPLRSAIRRTMRGERSSS